MNPYDRTEKIDNYLENNMSNEEKKEFERLLLDPSASLGSSMNLNEEVKMQKAIIQEIQRRALRQSLEEENNKYREEERKKKETWKKIGKITLVSSPFATAAIAAVMLVMFVVGPTKEFMLETSKMYAVNFSNDETRGALRGERDSIAMIRKAMAEDEWGDAQKHLIELKKVLISQNKLIPDEELFDLWSEYHWLQALCEMHEGHILQTKYHLNKLIENSTIYKDIANEYLQTMESKQRKLIRK